MKEVILGLLAAIGMLLVAALAFFARMSGADRERADTQGEKLDAAQEAKAARDRLRSDPAYRERVRDRFTR